MESPPWKSPHITTSNDPAGCLVPTFKALVVGDACHPPIVWPLGERNDAKDQGGKIGLGMS